MVFHAGFPLTMIYTRLVQVPPVFENCALSMAMNTSLRRILSKNPSHGKKFG